MENDEPNLKFDTDLNAGVEEIKAIKMTALEHERILQNVLNSPVPEESIHSPYLFVSIFQNFTKNRTLTYILMPCLLVVILGGGIVFASGNTLPGNFLYPVKVNIVEPVHAAFISSPEAKAQYESGLATERLLEAETLANQGKLDQSKETQLSNLLSDHTTALDKSLNNLHKNNSASEANISTNFQAQINAHAMTLDNIGQNDNQDKNRTHDKEEDTKLSQTARFQASLIQDRSKSEDDGNLEHDQDQKGDFLKTGLNQGDKNKQK